MLRINTCPATTRTSPSPYPRLMVHPGRSSRKKEPQVGEDNCETLSSVLMKLPQLWLTVAQYLHNTGPTNIPSSMGRWLRRPLHHYPENSLTVKSNLKRGVIFFFGITNG